MVSSLVKRDLKKILECFCLLAYLYNALFSSLCPWVLVAQLCLTLCDLMDCNPPGSSVHSFLGKNTGVDCYFLPQGIFLTQGLNSGLLHCREILSLLSHQGSPPPHLIRGLIFAPFGFSL